MTALMESSCSMAMVEPPGLYILKDSEFSLCMMRIELFSSSSSSSHEGSQRMSYQGRNTLLVKEHRIQGEIVRDLLLCCTGSRWSLLQADIEQVEQSEACQKECLGVVAFIKDQSQVYVYCLH